MGQMIRTDRGPPLLRDDWLSDDVWAPSANTEEPLSYRINRLRVASAVLHIGAHPDDEDGGMVAYLTHRVGARVVYWSATRGEGGQNRRGTETGDALGIVRTWESQDARSIDGGEILFGPFRDFGFSKSGTQTLSCWGRDDLVREIVRAIRIVQPTIVVSRWNGDARDGHGHHQAVGLVAAEAFEAAADPALHAELGLPAWRARKLYRSVTGDWQPGEPGEFGQRREEYERPGYVRLETGIYDPVAGMTYQEQATLSLNCHVSQGMGFVPPVGSYFSYYRLEAGPAQVEPYAETFFSGIDPTLAGFADDPGDGSQELRTALDAVQGAADAAAIAFDPREPATAGLALAEGLAVLADLQRDLAPQTALGRSMARLSRDFEAVAAACFGLRAELHVVRPHLTPGSRTEAVLRVRAGGSDSATVIRHALHHPSHWRAQPCATDEDTLARGVLLERSYVLDVPGSAAPSTPYWLREPSTPHRYGWPRVGMGGQPFDPPLLHASVEVDVGGRVLRLGAAARFRDGILGGFRDLPVSVLPAVEIAPRRRIEIFPNARADRRLKVEATIRCISEHGFSAAISLAVPEGFVVRPACIEVQLSAGGEARPLQFDVDVPPDIGEGAYDLRFQSGDGTVAVECQAVRLGTRGAVGPVDESNCTRECFRAEPAVVRLHVIEALFASGMRVGYVAGLKDDVVASLVRFDLDITMLDDEMLAYADLHAFDTIVVGPNAYQTRISLRTRSDGLLDYVAAGGVLVVQYQGYGFSPDLAPYPFSYSYPHDRVTTPDAPVEILDGAHPALRFPNEIHARDFDGWTVDRGLYFFGRWDDRYVPLLASGDVGESPRRGGLLAATYGRGAFVYVGFSLFRQVPAGVPGAIRLFANLLGLAEARIQQRMTSLQSIGLLASLSERQLHETARAAYERVVEDGTYLAREGEPGGDLFIIVTGTVEIVKSGPNGERIIRHAERGEAIGEFAVLANMARSASLRAAGYAEVLVLPADAFKDLLSSSPDLALRVMEMLVRKVITQGAGAEARGVEDPA